MCCRIWASGCSARNRTVKLSRLAVSNASNSRYTARTISLRYLSLVSVADLPRLRSTAANFSERRLRTRLISFTADIAGTQQIDNKGKFRKGKELKAGQSTDLDGRKVTSKTNTSSENGARISSKPPNLRSKGEPAAPDSDEGHVPGQPKPPAKNRRRRKAHKALQTVKQTAQAAGQSHKLDVSKTAEQKRPALHAANQPGGHSTVADASKRPSTSTPNTPVSHSSAATSEAADKAGNPRDATSEEAPQLQAEEPPAEPALSGQTVGLGSSDSLDFLMGLGMSEEATAKALAGTAHSNGRHVTAWQVRAADTYAQTVQIDVAVSVAFGLFCAGFGCSMERWGIFDAQIEAVMRSLLHAGLGVRQLPSVLAQCPALLACPAKDIRQRVRSQAPCNHLPLLRERLPITC